MESLTPYLPGQNLQEGEAFALLNLGEYFYFCTEASSTKIISFSDKPEVSWVVSSVFVLGHADTRNRVDREEAGEAAVDGLGGADGAGLVQVAGVEEQPGAGEGE